MNRITSSRGVTVSFDKYGAGPPGGKMRANYAADGRLGDSRTIENTVISYDPDRMISIRVSRAPEDFPFPNAIYDM